MLQRRRATTAEAGTRGPTQPQWLASSNTGRNLPRRPPAYTGKQSAASAHSPGHGCIDAVESVSVGLVRVGEEQRSKEEAIKKRCWQRASF